MDWMSSLCYTSQCPQAILRALMTVSTSHRVLVLVLTKDFDEKVKKSMSFLWTQFYFWVLKMLALFKARLWKGKAMKSFGWRGNTKYESQTIQSTLWEVTRFAFRFGFLLAKTPLCPRINMVVENLPSGVCSQVSPQVFRLGRECFGRWRLEVLLKDGEMGVKRWILNWTDGKALGPF